MIKQVINYEDFDGDMKTEIAYFHLSKRELLKLDHDTPGGLVAKLESIGKDATGSQIIDIFTWLLGKAYGKRIEGEGSLFSKSDEASEEFLNSLAFDAFFTQILTDPKLAAKFTNGLIPSDLLQIVAVQEAAAENTDATVHVLPDPNKLDTGSGSWPNTDDVPWAKREPTQEELMMMTRPQLQAVYTRKALGWKPDAGE